MTKRKPAHLKVKSHGQATGSRTAAYNSWAKMMDRCTNPSSDNYHAYGGVGITVCKDWLKFINFYADMGDRLPGTSLDRIDPTGNYELTNCRWATHSQQARNKRVSNNKFGCPGVSVDQKSGAFIAKVIVNKVTIPLYYGYNLDDAIAARIHWEEKNDYRH